MSEGLEDFIKNKILSAGAIPGFEDDFVVVDKDAVYLKYNKMILRHSSCTMEYVSDDTVLAVVDMPALGHALCPGVDLTITGIEGRIRVDFSK